MTVQNISMDSIMQGIQASVYELQTESRLARVGLKDEQDIAGVLARYEWLYNLETVRFAEDEYKSEDEPHRREELRRVYHYLLDGYIEMQTAAQEDSIVSFEMGATIEVDGEVIPYHNVRSVMATEPDLDRRDRLRDATLSIVERLNPDRLEIVNTRLRALASDFGYDSYTEYNAVRKGADYGLLRARLEDFLARTEDAYVGEMDRWVEATTGRRLGELGSHHFAFISRAPQFDTYFSKENLVDVYNRTLTGLGFDLKSQSNIRLDTEDRPKKNPRACCYAPDPPGEVHLIIKPIGGMDDYAAFFHEAGHAQHYGNEDPSLSYVDKVLGTSYALSEIYSFLMQFLTVNPLWLQDMVGIPADVASEAVYYAKLTEFFMVRRYVAKLQYELEFYQDPLNSSRNRELYTHRLGSATQFNYAEAPYLDDMDSGYYSADYLRAWITEAMVRHHLETTCGPRWYSSREAGAFLQDLWSQGEALENEDVARMIGYQPYDTTYLASGYLALAGANR